MRPEQDQRIWHMSCIIGHTKFNALFKVFPDFVQHKMGNQYNFPSNGALQIVVSLVAVRKHFGLEVTPWEKIPLIQIRRPCWPTNVFMRSDDWEKISRNRAIERSDVQQVAPSCIKLCIVNFIQFWPCKIF